MNHMTSYFKCGSEAFFSGVKACLDRPSGRFYGQHHSALFYLWWQEEEVIPRFSSSEAQDIPYRTDALVPHDTVWMSECAGEAPKQKETATDLQELLQFKHLIFPSVYFRLEGGLASLG